MCLHNSESLSPMVADLCREEIDTLKGDLLRRSPVRNDHRWQRDKERMHAQETDNWLRALQKKEREEQLLKNQELLEGSPT